jgi:glycosidase
VRVFRAVLDDLAPRVALLTETNVPQAENIKYFGNGSNEAHLIYNFALAPLVLHAFQTGQARVLTQWARDLTWPSDRVAYLNVLASHDGIGLNPVQGVLSEEEIEQLIRAIEQAGGLVSRKSNADGTSSPYEINANYFDALRRPGEQLETSGQVDRFATAHAILLAFKGLPGLYFHSLVGSRGWSEGVSQTGRKRSINRQKLDHKTLIVELSDSGTLRSQVYQAIAHLLRARRTAPAFSPQAAQCVLESNEKLFAFIRGGEDPETQVLCIHNVSTDRQPFDCGQWGAPGNSAARVHDLIAAGAVDWRPGGVVMLKPFQSMWLTTRRTGENF